MSRDAVLEAQDVVVRFGGLRAVDGVSLAIGRGEVVGLIGPNGAGKTTLLGALGGQLVPHAGAVLLDGEDVTEWSPERRSAKGLARTFQRLELFRKMTLFENLLVAAEAGFGEADFVRDLLGRSRRSRAEELAREVLGRVGLEGLAERWADEVPTGIGRLVEIGRALCTGPNVMLLDEPAGGLDEAETDRLGAVLRDVAAGDGLSLLLVEHDVRLVLDLCDRIYVMDFGRMIAEGTPRAIRRDPAVRDAYLGEVPVGIGARRT